MRRELVAMWNGLGNKPSLFRTVILIDEACNHESFSIINFIFPYFKFFFPVSFNIFSLYGNIFDLLFMFLIIVSAREEPLSCPCLTDRTRSFFCRKMEKKRSVKEEMDEKVFISRQSRHLSLDQ